MKNLVRLAALAATMMLGACATITSGSTQTVSVITDPPGASCELQRGGSVVGVMNPTPGSVAVSKSNQALSVVCRRDGYQDAGTSMASEFQGATLGNILLGGVIGLAVDAGSGAMHRYGDSIRVSMVPLQGGAPTPSPQRPAAVPVASSEPRGAEFIRCALNGNIAMPTARECQTWGGRPG